MKNYWMMGLPMLAFLACEPNEKINTMTYPETAKGTTVDTYFDTEVPDPYRWLEDDLSKETEDWVVAQNEVTYQHLNQIPYRESLRSRLETLWNYEKFSAPRERNGYTYFSKNDGLQNQYVIYRQKEGEAPEVFLDPNTFSEDGTTSLSGVHFTKSAKYCAYQISEGGSDWRKVIVIDVDSKEIIEDTLIDIKFSNIAWKGEEGFFYSSYDKPEEGSALSAMTDKHKLLYHKLGAPQSEDVLIFGGAETPRRYVGAGVSEDQRFLIISAAVSTSGNELYVKDLKDPEGEIKPIVMGFENEYGVVDTKDNFIYIETNLEAPNNRLVKVDFNNPEVQNWETVIEETDQVLSVSSGGGYFFTHHMVDATSKVAQLNRDGSLVREIELPGIGSAGTPGGKLEDTYGYYSFTNAITPSTIYKYDYETGKSELYKASNVQFNPDDYVSKQVFYTSKDGTKIPMIITHKKGIELNGKNPTMLYGYGGFNISLKPYFSTARIPWLEQGGVYAVANLRGGGEYGEAWHVAGTKMQKQNVFDDFIAAAEYLISKSYTSSDYLAINGGSNGGLLVGATMTQRPDLMRVAIPEVGVLDMLRYNAFTAGAGWAFDYGTAQDSKEMFEYLYNYSPLHALKEGTCYPATMVMTGDHDDRVVPAHSFKFAARLQEVQSCDNPTFIRIAVKAGHGAGKPTSMIIQEEADVWVFTLWNMGFKELPTAL